MARVVNDEHLIEGLRKLDRNIKDDIAGILLNAAEIVITDARRRARRLTGEMSDSIHAEIASKQAKSVVVSVGPDDKYFYSLFQEVGTGSHPIERYSARGMPVGNDALRASAQHPGVNARPFLRPALDENEDGVVAEIVTGLNRLID